MFISINCIIIYGTASTDVSKCLHHLDYHISVKSMKEINMKRRKLTEEQKKIRNEKTRATKLLRYGDPNYNNQEKHKQTCLEKYGVEHHNQTLEARKNISEKKLSKVVQDKYENTLLQRYGSTNVNNVPEIRDKYEKTLLKRYGVTNPLKSKEIKDKQLNTLRKHKTFNTSKQEKDYYNYLVNKYGKDDVLYQYTDSRYPYSCDFYIKSKDLFIELNLHWTHGGHPFDKNNAEDLVKLNTWKEKGNKYYNNAIYTWTELDVKKKTCAENHKLNYITIYKL